MAQTDSITMVNEAGQPFRLNLNEALQAIETDNSGTTAPIQTFAFQDWVDTSVTPPITRRRNATNTGWEIPVQRCDTITEATNNAGVTIEGVLHRDGAVIVGDAHTPATDAVVSIRKASTGASLRGLVHNTGTTAGTSARWDVSTGTANSYAIHGLTEQGASASYYELACGVAVTGGMYFTSATTSTPIVMRQSGTERFKIQADGTVTCNSPTGLGYGAGAGGSVTQLTDKSTAVTINNPVGRVLTHNQSLAAGETRFFQVNNNKVSASDVVLLTPFNTNGLNYHIWVTNLFAGAFVIAIKNISAAPLGEVISLNFAVIKGATA